MTFHNFPGSIRTLDTRQWNVRTAATKCAGRKCLPFTDKLHQQVYQAAQILTVLPEDDHAGSLKTITDMANKKHCVSSIGVSRNATKQQTFDTNS